MNPPRCFISYSWDSDSHRIWVLRLATRLRQNGIDAILDEFHTGPGTDLTKFMETSVRESRFVLLVCTPNFAKKANAGAGGVGYEKAIVTGEIFAGDAGETKFIPLLREGDAKESLPSFLKSRRFVDFHEDSVFDNKLEELLRHFFCEPLYQPPPVGPKPKFKTKSPPVGVKEAEQSRNVQVPKKKPAIMIGIIALFVVICVGATWIFWQAKLVKSTPDYSSSGAGYDVKYSGTAHWGKGALDAGATRFDLNLHIAGADVTGEYSDATGDTGTLRLTIVGNSLVGDVVSNGPGGRCKWRGTLSMDGSKLDATYHCPDGERGDLSLVRK